MNNRYIFCFVRKCFCWNIWPAWNGKIFYNFYDIWICDFCNVAINMRMSLIDHKYHVYNWILIQFQIYHIRYWKNNSTYMNFCLTFLNIRFTNIWKHFPFLNVITILFQFLTLANFSTIVHKHVAFTLNPFKNSISVSICLSNVHGYPHLVRVNENICVSCHTYFTPFWHYS